MELENIFTYHAPVGDQADRYTKLREAAKKYAEALISEKVLDEDNNLVMELAYEDYYRTLSDLVPVDSPEYDQAIKFIDQAYDIAVDPDRAIIQLVQAASFFANAAIALSGE